MAERKEQNDLWKSKWESSTAHWHMTEVHTYAKTFFSKLTDGNTTGKRILVPLCGATPDMAWFYEQGLTVVGIEISDIAIKKFFKDNNFSFTVETIASGKVFTHDERLKLFQYDLLDLTVEDLGGPFDFWWDRGSLVAITPDEEHNYVEKLCSFMSLSARCLMEVYEYDPSIRSGPPKCIFLDHLKKLFGNRFELTELSRNMEKDLPEFHSKLGIDNVHVTYLLSRIVENNETFVMTQRQELNEKWNSKWQAGQTRWHMGSVHTYLQTYFSRMTKDNVVGKRILVPMCGATSDLVWLYKQGLTVVGVELSSIAAKKFFDDNNLNYSVEEVSSGCKVFSHDERLKIIQCDFFMLTAEKISGHCDYFWDRGGLGAMAKSEQVSYVKQLVCFLSSPACGLIELVEYNTSEECGPPESISYEQLIQLLGKHFEIEELNRVTEDELPSIIQKLD